MTHSTKPLLIGQAPGPNTDPRRPLACLPRTGTGGRLCAIMGLTLIRYTAMFERTNLIHTFPGRWKRDDKWCKAHAVVAAEAMRPLLRGREVILVGRNVSAAFGYTESHLDFHEWYDDDTWKMKVSVIPHPSGRNHWYHKEPNREASRLFWAEYLGEKMPGYPLCAVK